MRGLDPSWELAKALWHADSCTCWAQSGKGTARYGFNRSWWTTFLFPLGPPWTLKRRSLLFSTTTNGPCQLDVSFGHTPTFFVWSCTYTASPTEYPFCTTQLSWFLFWYWRDVLAHEKECLLQPVLQLRCVLAR